MRMLLPQLNPNIIKSIFQIDFKIHRLYCVNYSNNIVVLDYEDYSRYLPDITRHSPNFKKLLNIVDIKTLYSIMNNIKQYKYIIDDSIIIFICEYGNDRDEPIVRLQLLNDLLCNVVYIITYLIYFFDFQLKINYI